jgi:hypothetical protein
MVTYRKDLARKGWHRSGLVRVLLGLLGVALVFVGTEVWALETEYGGAPDRQDYYVSQEAGRPVKVYDESGVVVFEGTPEEVAAWLRIERGARNYTVPILLLVGGALSIVAGVTPSPPSSNPAPPR